MGTGLGLSEFVMQRFFKDPAFDGLVALGHIGIAFFTNRMVLFDKGVAFATNQELLDEVEVR